MSRNERLSQEDKQKISTWLLESPTPSIRYFTLTRIKGKPESDPEVQTTRRLIAESHPALNIINQQMPEGCWKYKKNYYCPKYRSSHWSMLLLSELGIDPQHPAMQKGAEFMQACFEEDKRRQSHDQTFWGCLWGHALRYLLFCQRGSEAFVQEMQNSVVRDLLNLRHCRYNNDLPCAWGVARDLYGLALIPEEDRDSQTCQAIQTGLDFLLKDYDLVQADYPYTKKINELWSKISFPLFYQADILFVLRVAKELNALHYPQAQHGMDWLLSRRQKNGSWGGASPYRSRTWSFTAKGDSVKRWITLHALDVLG